jgi:uncharacterized membrane protein YczE
VPHDPAPLVVRAAIFVAGTLLVGSGVAMMVRADLGVTPVDVLTTGLAERFGMDIGLSSWLVATVLAVIAWILGRTPSIGTLAGAVLVGGAVSGGLAVLGEPSGILRPALLALGLVTIYLGIVCVVTSSVGTGPLELVMLALGDRGWRLDAARWAIELTIFTTGLLLGGQIGVGTALFAVCTGPVLAAVLPHTMRRMGTDSALPATATARVAASE